MINRYLEIQITKPIDEYLSKTEVEYYDHLSKFAVRKLHASGLDLNLENLVIDARIGIKDAKILQAYLKEKLEEEKVTLNWPLSNKELANYDSLSHELLTLLKNKPELRKGPSWTI